MIKLLIADDEDITRKMLASVLDWESLGVKIVGSCKDGIEAYDMILDESPDIVLTDISMPGLTGLELVQRVTRTDPQIQFVILSGYGEFEFAREAMKYGVKNYLLKPCKVEEILDTMQSICEEYRRRQKAAQETDRVDRINGICSCMSEEGGKEIITLCEDVLDLTQSTVDMDYLKMLAGNISVRFSATDVLSPNELSELMSQISKTESVEAMQQIIKSFICLAETRISRSSTVGNALAQQVMEYVTQNIKDVNMTLKSIAEKQLFMNVDYVSRQFKKSTGKNFSQYLTEQRVAMAKDVLLKYQDMKVQEVAEMVGCDNPQYFIQLFKKSEGVTPKRWIQRALADGE
ncbi:MAG: response regulator [Oscillospiraceae bacterium]